MGQKEDTKHWVLVTGGARRLGRAFCLAFARAGWSVVCHYQKSQTDAEQTQTQVQALGGDCVLLSMDLSQDNAAQLLLEQAVQSTGSLPLCIVNSASIFKDPTTGTSTQSLMQHFALNTALPLMLGEVLAQMLRAQTMQTAQKNAQTSGQVNGQANDQTKTQAGIQTEPEVMASTLAHGGYSVIHVLDQKVFNLNPDYFSYTVSKLALERSVQLQAQALAPQVRVCGLSPGLLFLSGTQTQANFDQASRVNLLQRPIPAADVAKAAVFLAQTASLTGFTLQADNGQHLVPLQQDVMYAVGAKETGQ